ncbi:hypothetical protein RHSIM_Rhsim09G0173000 [Rhododendron simsii]|uniref:Uncharacterized protein n=1 Tax=Rhododendron simsii TaxID=118357 RepID=A0A834GIP2_RHOSS|nr:hypothetical protein RHSIM_Rhsim09G0173000 [Rhododendron simsii]
MDHNLSSHESGLRSMHFTSPTGFAKVNLPQEIIKHSPISSTIIHHRTQEGHLLKTGYVKILVLSLNAAVDMENTVPEMEDQGVESYILDLRKIR